MSASNPLQFDPMPPATGAESSEDAWKQQIAARLAAHRQKKRKVQGDQPVLPMEGLDLGPKLRGQKQQVAAAVADRFSRQQSYREFLAAEAEAALRQAEAAVCQAEAAAEVATLNAQAIAVARQQLFDELQMWNGAEPAAPKLVPGLVEAAPAPAPQIVEVPEQEEVEEAIEEIEEPIAIFSVEPPVPLPANLIEFPRELVAPRKARPRLAEGPLREDAPESPQLRIFEVDAALVSTEPSVMGPVTPEWSSIRLDAATPAPLVEHVAPEISFALPVQTAPLQMRVMATLVDGMAVGASFLCFCGIFALSVHHITLDRTLGLFAAGILFSLFLGYHLLFFSFADQTPGMRYARIGLCTFSDENPNRKAMRLRLLAMLLSLAPLGLGYLWAFFDEDRLGWHDRISRMYQRSY